VRGYGFRSRGKNYRSQPVWQGQLEPIGDSFALGFLDVMEVLFVVAFVDAGVSWFVIRKAREKAKGMFPDSHPFCTRGFATDGHRVFVKLHQEAPDSGLVDIASDQRVFPQVVNPLLKQLEFTDGGQLLRWWPLGEDRLVVLDPARNFGRPIVARKGVPTEVLAGAAKSIGLAKAALWFEVSEEEMRDAQEYEQKLEA
jgi:uncharacterized protein (DUF433 family)